MKNSKYILCLMGAILNSVTTVHGGKKNISQSKWVITHQESASEELKKIFQEYDDTKNVGDLFFNLQCFFNGVREITGSNYHFKIKKYYQSCSDPDKYDDYRPTKLWGTTQLGNIWGTEDDVDEDSECEDEDVKFSTAYANIADETTNFTVPKSNNDDDIKNIDVKAIHDTERSIMAARNLTKSIKDFGVRYRKSKRKPKYMKYLREIYIGLFRHQCKKGGDKKVFQTPFGECTITRSKSTSKKEYKDKIESICGSSKYSYKYIADILGKLSYKDMQLCMHIIKDFLKVEWCEDSNYIETVEQAINGKNIKTFNQHLSTCYPYDNKTKKRIKRALVNLCGMAMVSEPLRTCDGGQNQRNVYCAICYALKYRKLVNTMGHTQRKNLKLLMRARKTYWGLKNE